MAGLGDRKTFSISATYLRDSAGEKVEGKILEKIHMLDIHKKIKITPGPDRQ